MLNKLKSEEKKKESTQGVKMGQERQIIRFTDELIVPFASTIHEILVSKGFINFVRKK